MTHIDTSTDAVEALLAERDEYKRRAEQAEKREQCLKDSTEEARQLQRELSAVKRERDQLRAEVERYKKALDREKTAYREDTARLKGRLGSEVKRGNKLQAEVERLKAQTVTVKPLEWHFVEELGEYYTSNLFGEIETAKTETDKAAAQADYESRILSAITARTEDEVWNEAIEAASDRLKMEEGTLISNRVIRAIRDLPRPTKGETK